MPSQLQDVQASTLLRFRKESGKTLRQVADEAHIAFAYLSEIERSKAVPSPHILDSLLKCFNVTPDKWYQEQLITYNKKEETNG